MWWGLPVKWAGGAQVPVSSWRAQTAIWNNGGIRSVHFKALVLIVAVLAATQVPAVAADMAPAAPGYLPAAPSAPASGSARAKRIRRLILLSVKFIPIGF